ncbi:MAG TPA: hypothetical protein VLE74_03030 [Candidatus Saccharimonadales bacterium]|nr:hypothetical protein [Candidatus Saccharimonadales bacterium]
MADPLPGQTKNPMWRTSFLLGLLAAAVSAAITLFWVGLDDGYIGLMVAVVAASTFFIMTLAAATVFMLVNYFKNR